MLFIGIGIGVSRFTAAPAVAAPPAVELSRDTFTDANGTALTAHVPDLGPAWQEATGGTAGYTIEGNQLSRTDPTIRHAFMDVGEADVKVTIEATHCENLVGLLIRRSDTSHYWEVFYDFGNDGWQMSLVNGGADEFKGPLLPGNIGTISLEAKGNTITATGPGGDQHTEIDATLNTNTQVGIIVDGFGGVPSTVDSWSVTET